MNKQYLLFATVATTLVMAFSLFVVNAQTAPTTTVPIPPVKKMSDNEYFSQSYTEELKNNIIKNNLCLKYFNPEELEFNTVYPNLGIFGKCLNKTGCLRKPYNDTYTTKTLAAVECYKKLVNASFEEQLISDKCDGKSPNYDRYRCILIKDIIAKSKIPTTVVPAF
jgi:hypothetical protein